jgi:hypothetical protein
MRRIEREATATATSAVSAVAVPASPSAVRLTVAFFIASAVLPVFGVVAILGGLLLLTRPVAPLTSGAAWQVKKLNETHATLGG